MKGWQNEVKLSGVFYRKGKLTENQKQYYFPLLQQDNIRTKWFSLVAFGEKLIARFIEMESKGKQCILLLEGMITYDRAKKINRVLITDFEIIKELPIDLLENTTGWSNNDYGKKSD